MLVPNAQLEDKPRVKQEYKRCGYSWFTKEGEGIKVCSECNGPHQDKEHCNVNRQI